MLMKLLRDKISYMERNNFKSYKMFRLLAQIFTKKQNDHLIYLMERLVILSFFSDQVSLSQKKWAAKA